MEQIISYIKSALQSVTFPSLSPLLSSFFFFCKKLPVSSESIRSAQFTQNNNTIKAKTLNAHDCLSLRAFSKLISVHSVDAILIKRFKWNASARLRGLIKVFHHAIRTWSLLYQFGFRVKMHFRFEVLVGCSCENCKGKFIRPITPHSKWIQRRA